MDAAGLRALQAPIKERYKTDPKAAVITLKAKGSLDDANIACKVETGRALAVAGLHPATGGSGSSCAQATCCSRRSSPAPASRSRRSPPRSTSRSVRHGLGRRRPRFPRHARRRQGRAGRLRADPPALRPRHRRAAGEARSAAQAHRALLRGLPDDQERPAGGDRADPQVIGCVIPGARRCCVSSIGRHGAPSCSTPRRSPSPSPRWSRRALLRRAARLVVGAGDRPCDLHRVERAVVDRAHTASLAQIARARTALLAGGPIPDFAPLNRRLRVFASCALSA